MRMRSKLVGLSLVSALTACANVDQLATGSEADDAPAAESDGGVESTSAALQNAQRSSKKKLLHEIRHSATRVTQFWELGDGELAVINEGLIEKDGLPDPSTTSGTALEIFNRIAKGEKPPQALLDADARSRAATARVAKARATGLIPAPTEEGGPGPVDPSERPAPASAERSFLNVSWWTTTACSKSGYSSGYWSGSTWFAPMIECWDSPMRYVYSGAYNKTREWVAMYSGWGSAATYKHWWISCTDYVLFTKCSWDHDSDTVAKGYYRTWTAGGGTTDRAGDVTTPNDNTGSALFSLKFYQGGS